MVQFPGGAKRKFSLTRKGKVVSYVLFIQTNV